MPTVRVKVFSPIDEGAINQFLTARGNRIEVRDIRIAGGSDDSGDRAEGSALDPHVPARSVCLILYEERGDPLIGRS
jgi:hypothetical protein